MQINLADPLFKTYAIAAAILILKMALQSWMTVARMMKVKGGFKSPEDLKRSPANPNPKPDQLQPNEYVERSRRVHANDTENIPIFLVAGFLFVLAEPSLLVARIALFGYAITRILHSIAYLTAQLHDVRALFWSLGSFALIGMTGFALITALT